MRIALLTLEALANARAVRRFVAAHAQDIALVGLSDPFRPEAGGAFGQTWRHLRRSGPRLLPYLALNFAVPRWAGLLRPPRRDGVILRRPADIPLLGLCASLGMPVVAVPDVNDEAFRRRLQGSGADLLLTFHFDQILSAETIAAVPLGGINVHAGLLPRHRGPTPTLHALLDRPVALGVSIHRLVPRIDAGPLLAQAALADQPGLTALAAARLLHDAALPLLGQVLDQVRTGRAAETELAPLPYRGFPSREEMRQLRRSGRAAAGWRDLRAALATPIRDR